MLTFAIQLLVKLRAPQHIQTELCDWGVEFFGVLRFLSPEQMETMNALLSDGWEALDAACAAEKL